MAFKNNIFQKKDGLKDLLLDPQPQDHSLTKELLANRIG